MLQINAQFKTQVVAELLNVRNNYDGSDNAFSKQWGINNTVYSQLKGGKVDGLLKDGQWLTMGRELGVSLTQRKWHIAKTDVYRTIEADIDYCQQNSKSMMFVDDSEIGKTVAGKHLARNRKNCFYLDASQAKTKMQFIRLLAKTIGLDQNGKYAEVKENIKFYLKMLPTPVVIIDEAGDMGYHSFLELKELWNATEFACGWYMIGADGLRTVMEKGIRNKKPGYRELYSRFSSNYSSATPNAGADKVLFYKKLIEDVLSVNMDSRSSLNKIVAECLKKSGNGTLGGLRRAEGFMILNQQ